ncbi:hypothetical protein BH23ACT7_BH23ACT7_04040 [soil metagenome]
MSHDPRPVRAHRRQSVPTLLALVVVLAVALPGVPASAADPYTPIGRTPFREGSGVVASRAYPGVYWSHQDAGGGTRNVLYAFKVSDGRLVDLIPGVKFRRIRLPGLVNRDWEDIAIDGGYLWLGDIGNNGDCTRTDLAVHKIREPDPYRATSASVVATYPFVWPDVTASRCTGRNAESLVVLDGKPYLISKSRPPGLYRFSTLSTSSRNLLKKLGTLTPPAGGFAKPATGADLSMDGRRLAVSTAAYNLYVYKTSNAGLRGEALLLDLISRPPAAKQQYRRDGGNEQVEGVAFVRGRHDIVLLSEARKILYFPVGFYD